jgi:Fe-S cluster assembly protein SufD
MDKLMLKSLFAPFDRNAATPKYRALRQAARERFASLPLPTARTEDWRFTNIAPLLETPFELARPLGSDSPSPPPANVHRLVFVNGRYEKSLSPPIPPGLRVGSLLEANPVPASLGQIAESDSVFTALNTSFLNEGAFVEIPDGKVVEKPIEIVHIATPADKPIVLNPRALIVVGKDAQATIIERFLGNGVYFSNAVTEIAVGEHAVVDHVKLQQECPAAYHVANTQVVMAARGTFSTHYLSLGGSLVRNEVRVRFDGEHAEATVNGLYLANGKQHIDNFTVIDHAQPNCASHELYKGILDGKAHGVFNGKIFVRKDAQKTDAKQTNKVLLLSDDATINTKPQLEIFADDVKCTHGATVGQLDAVQLFYLQSRGIPLDAARRLLTFAFANDIVGRVKIEAIRAELESRIVR